MRLELEAERKLKDLGVRLRSGSLVAGVDLNPALIPRKLLILQYAKLAQLAKTANLSYTFPTLSMKPDSRLLPLKPRHDSSAPSNGLSVSRFSVACNAQ
jgi:hypothetical protein